MNIQKSIILVSLILFALFYSGCEKEKKVPIVVTSEVSNISWTTAESGGNIVDDNGFTVVQRGVIWSTNPKPTISDKFSNDGAGAGEFSSQITGLLPNTTYFVRAYAQNSEGLGYGMTMSFKTKETEVGSVETAAVVDISATSAISGGSITSDGGATIIARGVCWNTNPDPTINDNKTIEEGGSGSFVSILTPLLPSTTYYARAYVTNSEGTSYGSQANFMTYSGVVVLTTKQASDIRLTSASTGGIIESDGHSEVTTRGICWSLNPEPTISDNVITSGNGIGEFNVSLNSLEIGTKYYLRAFATNSVNTYYGAEKSFTTHDGSATLTTSQASTVTSNSAQTGGTITHDGFSDITSRGLCWSTNQNPTTEDNVIACGSGLGQFTETITDLSPNTTYYVRAFATNTIKTTYGNQVIFKTTSGTVNDADGNAYGTIEIGTQWWMAQNLLTTKLNDNTPITLETNGTTWAGMTTPAYCWYNNDEATSKPLSGALYNWYAVETGKLCPDGWHVPTDSDWITLLNYLGGASSAGGKMKQAGFLTWLSPNTGATNESGFNALGAGFRFYLDGQYKNKQIDTYFWSSTPDQPNTAWRVGLSYSVAAALHSTSTKPHGFSVRCIKN